ncbi:D-tyrosyl-tRNA(Tyr) deacylase [Clavibacter michiganensis]|uniref:hypothetical protein n=1 Tax=Clavibacter michiganensis TaxID=28447 RepID=UPI001AE2B39E|nr:hypothetical protein [Clavibacter michiganensis]MBP2457922.1 D-tyrosyl-tRNA(Tyr) deacylase [Clavibacter michiganensis]MDQ0410492.1 D-tyrosyl-tRNA(Tyr) deacylase [Clavibacter michiganensis]
MPAIVAPTTASSTAAADAATAPLPGDPTCVAFAGGADGFRLAGTRSLEVDLAPMLAATHAAARVADAPLAA